MKGLTDGRTDQTEGQTGTKQYTPSFSKGGGIKMRENANDCNQDFLHFLQSFPILLATNLHI